MVHAKYFFGKALENATVTIDASKFDVEFVLFQTITGQTDSDGFFSFDVVLPSYFVGLPLEQGDAFVKLDIKVEDTAEHVESVVRELTITKDPIHVRVIPESGKIVLGVENKLYLMTTDPKGRGLATTNLVDFDGQVFHVDTDDEGLGSFTVTPDENASLICQVASQANGKSVLAEIDLSDTSGQDRVLVRTDHAIYRVGQTMTIDVYTPENVMARRAFVDIVKERQTLYTKGLDIVDGQGELLIDLSQDMAGTLLVEAYYISQATETASDVFRDKKIVYVNPALEIQVATTLDQDEYLPGEKARIIFEVTPPQTAALGVTIVDEAVFALQENRPALLKVYFSMEEDIMQPRFMPLMFPFEETLTSEELTEDVQEMVELVLATVEEPDDPGLDESSYPNLVLRMKEALVSRINKDADTVAKDLGNQSIYNEGSYNNALNQGTIATYQDPWGNPYKLKVGTNQVTLTSNGPDEIAGNMDDISLVKDYQRVYKPYEAPQGGGGWAVPGLGGIGIGGIGMGGIGMGGFGIGGFGMGGFAMGGFAMGGFAMGGFGGGGGGGGGFAAYGGGYGGAAGGTGGTYVPETGAGYLAFFSPDGETPPEEKEPTQEPRKIRKDFPETLLWEPLLITDPNGMAYMDANMADSITTWRMSTMASTLDGKLGGNTEGIVVFQDFFIDLDLPVALTRNDEISMPVAIYNYLDESQTVYIRLDVDQNTPWFELMDVSEKQVDLEAGEITVVYFRIRALEVGWHELTVFGYGTQMSDAIARRIEVLPDGMAFHVNVSDRLRESEASHVIHIPHTAIDEASKILVKIYPGIFSQVVEGLDRLFKVPHGCFTQSTTITWPNVLVLDYMITTNQITPEIEMKAREYINLGYQRLLTFECPNGGFSWYGKEPGKPILTAYGLMEFTDMARVQYVDPDMIERTQEWLISKQQADGSWPPDQVRELFNVISNKLQGTAFATWALIHSGYSANDSRIIKGLDYVRSRWDDTDDTYTQALCAHALLEVNAQDSTGLSILDILETKKIVEGDTVHWSASEPSFTYSRGDNLDLETTAMITWALIKAGWRYPQSINGAINYIVRNKDAIGLWRQTQATVLSLRVLMLAMGGQTEEMDGEIVVTINGQALDKDDLPILKINPVDSSVMRQIDLQPYTSEGDNDVSIRLIGEDNLLYQIVGTYFIPWAVVTIPSSPQLEIDLSYDRTQLAVDDIILCTVTVTNTVPNSVTQLGMLDLGIPPGFRVFWEDFEKAIEEDKIFKYESTNRQLTLYLHPLIFGEPLSITYRLQAKYPLKVATPKSRAYDFYNPDVQHETKPITITVVE